MTPNWTSGNDTGGTVANTLTLTAPSGAAGELALVVLCGVVGNTPSITLTRSGGGSITSIVPLTVITNAWWTAWAVAGVAANEVLTVVSSGTEYYMSAAVAGYAAAGVGNVSGLGARSSSVATTIAPAFTTQAASSTVVDLWAARDSASSGMSSVSNGTIRVNQRSGSGNLIPTVAISDYDPGSTSAGAVTGTFPVASLNGGAVQVELLDSVGANQPPTADAGTDQTDIEPYTTVTHAGSGTDSDGTISSYAWTQTGGSPTAAITGANSATMSYTAPGTIAGTSLTFQLTVTDNDGGTGTDTVQDTIYPVTERAVIGGAEVPVHTSVVGQPAGLLTEIWTAQNGQLVRRGATAQPYSASNEPWQLQSGESVDDNRPSGVNVVNYADYSQGNTLDFGATMTAVRNAQTSPYYVRMPAGTFHITSFSFGSGSYMYGYKDTNSTRLWGGLIGAGADKTFIVLDPNVFTQDQLNTISSGSPSPDPYATIYSSEGNMLGIPNFYSGITFRGNFQQQISLSGYSGTAPAPYNGLVLRYAVAGSMVQYCRFQGFAFAAANSPPYELGAIGSTHSSWTLLRSEIDGRLAPEIDSSQPVASGGLMWNYEIDVKAIDSWLHHTRRSGFAMHDHSINEGSGNGSDPGVYYVENFQDDNLCCTSDSYAGSGINGFSPSNVEELRQTFTYVSPNFTNSYPGATWHITLSTGNGNTIANGVYVTDPVIGNTSYNGCLVIRILKHGIGSTANSPWYAQYLSGGLGSLPITVTNAGVTLTPILSTSFNAATNDPSNSYVVLIS